MNAEMNEILEKIAVELDISDSVYKQVVDRYESVGKWLARDGSIVSKYKPIIYPQGSVQLGTIVKPITDEDEYDIDLVCELTMLIKSQITQHELKDLIGTEINGYAVVNSMNSKPAEGRRCWTLEYANASKFHMDILPAIPDGIEFTKSLDTAGISNQWSAHAIAITDQKSETYDQYSYDWPQSNPKGYALWFRSRMPELIVERMKAHVEPVMQHIVKTPLQQAIQILKRHRDIMFADLEEYKPISIILTTLAAHAYNGEEELDEALLQIVNHMGFYIGFSNGVAYIPNPSNPNENFADKWREHPERENSFREWLQKVQRDFRVLLEQENLSTSVDEISLLLGERTVNRAAAQVLEKANARIYKNTVLPKEDVRQKDGPILVKSNPSPWGKTGY